MVFLQQGEQGGMVVSGQDLITAPFEGALQGFGESFVILDNNQQPVILHGVTPLRRRPC